MTGKRSFWLGIITIGLATILGLAACGPKTATLRIEAQDFKFIPEHWSVPAGAKVTLTLNNTGALDHTWIIMKQGTSATMPFDADDEPNVLWKAEAKAGESQTFTFDAPTDPGEYEVVCGTPAHLEQGMKGSLTVTQ
jgi:plastocyanin